MDFPNRNVGRTDLSGEFGSVQAPRETDPTPAVTRPGAGPASAMVKPGHERGEVEAKYSLAHIYTSVDV